MVDNFIRAAKLLKRKYGEIDVSWGKVNKMIRGGRSLSLGGGPDIMHSIYGDLKSSGELEAFAGDSYILFATWDKHGNVSSKSVHQYGAATTNKNSPHYSDNQNFLRTENLRMCGLKNQIS